MSKDIIRVLSFDPGIVEAGWSVNDYCRKTGVMQVTRYGELTPNKTVGLAAMRGQVAIFGKRVITLANLEDMVNALMQEFVPDYVVSEDAFLQWGRTTAYAALLQWLTTVEKLLYRTYQKPLTKLAPKMIKRCATGSGGGDKVTVQDAIFNNKLISFKQKKALGELSSHEADSIAVGFTFVTEILPNILTMEQ